MNLTSLRQAAKLLKRDTVALYFAARDPRTPWTVRLVVGGVVAYALSPIDLIPDFIPVVGLLDDIILVPLGIRLALRMVPTEVMNDARARVVATEEQPKSLFGATIVVGTWLAFLAAATVAIVRSRR